MAKRGRPRGAKTNKPQVVSVLPSRCQKCGSTERGKYFGVTEQEFAGLDESGRPYTHIVRKRTICATCGQQRIDRILENRVPRQDEGKPASPDGSSRSDRPASCHAELPGVTAEWIERGGDRAGKDLTPYERSKTMAEYVEAARDVAKKEAEEERAKPKPIYAQPLSRNRGRPSGRESGSTRDVEQRTGIPAATATNAKKHVAAADSYKFMQAPNWTQSAVLNACRSL